jgi:hypothetical protein
MGQRQRREEPKWRQTPTWAIGDFFSFSSFFFYKYANISFFNNTECNLCNTRQDGDINEKVPKWRQMHVSIVEIVKDNPKEKMVSRNCLRPLSLTLWWIRVSFFQCDFSRKSSAKCHFVGYNCSLSISNRRREEPWMAKMPSHCWGEGRDTLMNRI